MVEVLKMYIFETAKIIKLEKRGHIYACSTSFFNTPQRIIHTNPKIFSTKQKLPKKAIKYAQLFLV